MFVVAISRPRSKMGHVGSKNRSPSQILENAFILKLYPSDLDHSITLKNLLSQVSIPGPSGPSCFIILTEPLRLDWIFKQ